MKLRELHFNSTIVALTSIVVGYLVYFDKVNIDSIVGLFGGVVFNVSLLLVVGFSLQKIQNGWNYNIQTEIYENQNIAAAIYQLGIWLALALVIAKGLL